MFLIFRSDDGSKRFDMGGFVSLGMKADDVKQARAHVLATIRGWSPEERWNDFILKRALEWLPSPVVSRE